MKTVQDLALSPPEGAREGLKPRAAYMHVPFCARKCDYCDFFSVPGGHELHQRFIERMAEELAAFQEYDKRPLASIYVGGGTPTILGEELWRRLLCAINEHLPRENGAEFTVEANPETVSEPLIETLACGGVNRLSIGAQSFKATHLGTLGRVHEPAAVSRAVEIARAVGISNISLDLIFAIPGQTLDDWLMDLDAALALGPAHLSCYCLTYEPGTPLEMRKRRGLIEPAGEKREAEMYESAMDRLAEAGLRHYEISNWARDGFECRHNLSCWRNEQFWPFGPGAAGHINNWRWKNAEDIEEYLAGGTLPPITEAERLDEDGRIGEELMLGLRLVDGIDEQRVDRLLASTARGAQRTEAIDRHIACGLLERTGGHLRLTRRGLLLADNVMSDLI